MARFLIRSGLKDVGDITIENKVVTETSKEFRYMKGWIEASVYEYIPKLKLTLIRSTTDRQDAGR